MEIIAIRWYNSQVVERTPFRTLAAGYQFVSHENAQNRSVGYPEEWFLYLVDREAGFELKLDLSEIREIHYTCTPIEEL